MAKRLKITYGDVTLYDGEPEQVSWRESEGSITVKAGAKPANPLAGPLGEQLKQAFAARRQQ